MPTGDNVYYEATENLPLASKVLAYARRQVFSTFMSEMEPSSNTTIIDIGVSETETAESNFLEKAYPHKHNITCVGIGDGAEIRAANPDVSYISIKPGQPLPFPDNAFDIAYSNAVLEHVGCAEQRSLFLKDALRVASSLFFAVPNRWFPIEHHTGIPMLHYCPLLFRKIVGNTHLDYWSHQKNLDFLDMSLLKSEWPGLTPPILVYTGIRFGLLSSNIAIIARA